MRQNEREITKHLFSKWENKLLMTKMINPVKQNGQNLQCITKQHDRTILIYGNNGTCLRLRLELLTATIRTFF